MEVLVLNKSWNPIGTASVRKAMSMLFSGHARAIDVDTYQIFDWKEWKEYTSIPLVHSNDQYISTSTYSVRIPYVITLSRYNGTPSKRIGYSRRALYIRDNNTCQYCNIKMPNSKLTVDHVIPRSRGGKTSWDNCVLACVKCNSLKGDALLEHSSLTLKTKPKSPGWRELIFPQKVFPPEWKSFIKK